MCNCSGISEQEKQSLKRSLISNFNEPVNQIAVQIAVLISKICRHDLPKDWPDLFPTLMQGVESTDPLIQHRSLLTFHNVIKVLSSKRLTGMQHFYQWYIYNKISLKTIV